MKFTITLFFLFAFLQMPLHAQSLSYSGANSFNITSPTHVGAYVIPTQEIKPTGMIFGDSGTKFYMVGSEGDFVIQYSLSTAYDISSRGPIVGYFDVSGEESNPQDVAFNDVGTKMYILGGAGDDVVEYVVAIPWNVSSINKSLNMPVSFNAEAAINTYLSTANEGDNLSGLRFNTNGSKLFIVDYSSDKVFEFSCSAYDISTATIVGDLDISGEELQARAIEFNNDGTVLYAIGYSGDDINSYNLGTSYDLSSLTTKTVSTKLTAEKSPEALLINNDGTKVYVAGFVGQDIKEYALSPGYDFTSISAIPAASTIFETLELNPLGMVFNTDGSKLFIVGSTSERVIEMHLSIPYDISTAILLHTLSIDLEEKIPEGLAFNNTGSMLYVIGSDVGEINEYALSSAFDVSSSTHLGAISVSIAATDNETSPRDIYFNTDGSKLFVLAGSTDRIYQFTLSSDYNLSTLATDIDGFYSVNSVDTRTEGFAFNTDGSKFYIAGDTGDDINEFTLTNNFDLTSGIITNTNTFSVSSEEGTISDIKFNGDGSRFYITGTGDDEMNQYYSKGLFPETPNDGTIDDTTKPFLITLTGDTFFASSGIFTASEVTIGNVPLGLTAVLTLNSATEAQLSFIGKANSHINSDEAAANLIFTFTDAAFTSSNAVDVSFAVGQTNVLSIDFIECADNEIVYNGTTWTGGNNSGVPNDSATDLTKGIRTQGNITITANTNCDCLHVESGKTLTVADGVELTVANSLELNGDIRLLGTAQLKQTHTGVKNASGAGNLYKDVKGNLKNVYQSSYWSSPVTTNGETYNIKGVLKDGTTPLTETNTPLDINFSADFDGDYTTSPITLSTRWLAKFVNSGDWTRQINESTTLLNPVEGFNKKSTGNSTGQNYTFVGKPNDGDYTSEIAAYGSGTWSVLGNPYPTPIKADTFISDNAGVIVGTLYFYDSGDDTSHYTGEYLGGYATRTSGVGAPASGLGGVRTKTPDENIDIGQGFFVEASASGGTINFNNAQRVFDIVGSSTEVYHKNNAVAKKKSFPILRIGFEFLLTDQTYHRQVSVGLRGLTAEYEDGYEAEMWDYKSTDMALKIENKDFPYAITGIEDFDQSLMIPLKVQTNLNREVTFKIDNMTDIDSEVYLYDNVTQNYFDITSVDAIVNLDAGVYNDRFFITFNQTVLGLDVREINKFTVKNQDKQLVISSKEILEDVQVYNLLGQNVASKKNHLKETEVKVNILNLKKGIYIIRVRNSKGSFSKKISVY
ncbi:T9SS type A sorting domain-containing protein [Polaribacter sp. 11A2H]|uniref:T9SS type A sorting domain-containing protein n=1 Tax=Polaribacter sp. 11A2H TaxID=2687290 RepID=UPI00140A7AE6|nr:T9SS type A sorting domain-containing protein [Polaribacter sp. 11A2H]